MVCRFWICPGRPLGAPHGGEDRESAARGLLSTPGRTGPCWGMTAALIACALGHLAPPWSEPSQGMRP